MKELIEYIARSLVDDPSEVSVRENTYGSKTEFSLKVAKKDMGRIIGRHGRVANAIRTLLQVAAANQDERVFLNITEPE
jgi:predicted RNA-binding protein YlqC (UPF0109 family)